MKVRIVVCVSVVLCLAGVVRADTRWTAAMGDLWSNPGNWTNGVPTVKDKAQFVDPTLAPCILDFEGAVAKHIAVGDGGGGTLKVIAGSLTVADWSIMGYAESNVGENAGHFEVSAGVVNCQQRLFVGFMGEGHMTVDADGTVNVNSQTLGLGENGGSGFVKLEGGTVNLYGGPLNLSLRNGTASMDFRGGVLTLPDTSQNQGYLNAAIGDGIIKAYGGEGQIVTDTQTTQGRIIVRGVHPLHPSPIDGGRVSAGAVELNWVLPEPFKPGQTILVDVYFGTSQDFPVGGSAQTPQIIGRKNVSSVVVQTQPKKRYYWAVDSYIGSPQDPVLGPVFSFVADNLAPTVKAGDDVLTWMKNGSVDVTLDATVTDDGYLRPYTVKWTVVSEPNEGKAVLSDANAEDTVATLSATGQYVLQIEANDGEYTGSDTVTINVYNDSCEAAKSLPDFALLPGDINEDCIVNDLDLAILQEHWLECNALDCNDL